jgi:hypothetical protein
MIDDSQQPPRERATVVARGMATLAGWYGAVMLAGAVLIATLPDHKTDGTCDGIGFGCTPNPRDGALIVIIVYGIPLLCASLLASGATLAIAVAAQIRSGVAAGTLAAFAGFAAAVAIPVALAA